MRLNYLYAESISEAGDWECYMILLQVELIGRVHELRAILARLFDKDVCYVP